MRHAVDHPDVLAEDEPVAADYLAVLRIPDDHLAAGHGAHRVELVDVAVEARASSGAPERNLAQAPDLAHRGGGVERIDDINLVVAFVGLAEHAVGRELRLHHIRVNPVDNLHFCHSRLSNLELQTLKRKCITSPSCTTYSLPSTPIFPASRTALSEPSVT